MDKASADRISVLYVEDEPGTRMQVMHLLKGKGHECLVAQDGQEGLELYRRHRPDIVLVDISMPVLNGLELSRQIRTEDPETQIVILSAFDSTENMLAAIDIGVNQFVVKPVEPDKLFTAISRCIHQLHLNAQSRRTSQLEAINTLASGMAHDFNNLLQPILACISLARKRSADDSKMQHYFDLIEPSTKQAITLSQQLISLASPGYCSKKTIQLPPLIQEAVHSVLNDSQITCEFSFSSTLPEIRCCEEQIQQLARLLTLNALEAMPEGGKLRICGALQRIETSNHSALPPGEYLKVSFDDSGRGIPTENLRRIFEPYFTTKEMASRKGEGLGLTVCNSIIHQHNGMLTVNSKPEMGATFTFWLPTHQTDPPGATKPQ